MNTKNTQIPWITKERIIYAETGNGATIATVDSESHARQDDLAEKVEYPAPLLPSDNSSALRA
jgi:hypothetical protein